MIQNCVSFECLSEDGVESTQNETLFVNNIKGSIIIVQKSFCLEIIPDSIDD